jgi:hypothetical protein
MAKAAKRKMIDTTEHQVGQDKPRDMPSTGEARIEASEIELVDGPDWKKKAEALAFMEEPVEVMVHETADKNAETIVEVFNSGRRQMFIRGQVQTVKRKFVEVLARAKHTVYRQERYKDHEGNDAIRNIPMTALRYPFSIVSDTNPKGRDWLKKILAEA